MYSDDYDSFFFFAMYNFGIVANYYICQFLWVKFERKLTWQLVIDLYYKKLYYFYKIRRKKIKKKYEFFKLSFLLLISQLFRLFPYFLGFKNIIIFSIWTNYVLSTLIYVQIGQKTNKIAFCPNFESISSQVLKTKIEIIFDN